MGLLDKYQGLTDVYDEYFDSERKDSAGLGQIIKFLGKFQSEEFYKLHQKSIDLFREGGITFNVYSDLAGQEKIFPFDLFPRVLYGKEWQYLEEGLKQRVMALNLFLQDIYGEQKIINDGYIPKELIFSSEGYLPQMKGVVPPQGVYIHIAGIDLIREGSQFFVLEDNLKVPSGVSYVLENRHVMKKLFPNLFLEVNVNPIDDYPIMLRHQLCSLAEGKAERPFLVLLTPGPYNAAYFEHTYLAHRMGCPLVQNNDLVVIDNMLYLKSIEGLQRVDVLYSRVNDKYLDPTVLNPESTLGIPGLIKAYRSGNIILANAPGNGVADDKAIYPYVPKIIRYYLNQEAILPQVPTYSCMDEDRQKMILNKPQDFVIKLANQSGGYGMVIGPQATKQQLEDVCEQIRANPRDYIAQPLKQLSTCPTFFDGAVHPRRVDLRPFIITGKSSWVLPGGLTRVALKENSYIVNSSQGGGSKDTWVLKEL